MASGLALVALLLTMYLSMKPAVTIAITPRVAFAPAFVRLQIRVERNPENRTLIVEANAPEAYRRSDVQLDGEDAPITTFLEWPALDAGEYEVSARVTSNTTLLASAKSSITVLGRE